MFWQFFTAFGIMLGYISGAIFRSVLDGTNNDICPQPAIPPPLTPSPKPLAVQQKLLSIRCVSDAPESAIDINLPLFLT